MTVRVGTATAGVLWVVCRVLVSLVLAVVGVGGAGDAAGWWWCCSWSEVMVGGNTAVLGLWIDPVW